MAPSSSSRPAAGLLLTSGRRRFLRRARPWALWSLFGLIVLGVAWLAVTAVIARHDLVLARQQISTLRKQIVAGDLSAAQRTSRSIRHHAHRAHQLTTGPAWALAAAVPGVGAPAHTVRGLTDAVDQLGSDALPELIDAAQGLDPHSLLTGGGTVDVAAIQKAAPAIHRADTAAAHTRAQVTGMSGSWLGPVSSARKSLLTQLTGLTSTLSAGDRAARVLPPMLGAQRPQRYFVGLLNTAESRGVGGLPGAFIILIADHGKLHVEHYGSDTELTKVRANVTLGAEYQANYGQANPLGNYVNSTISPNFPYAAQIWASMWQQKSGEKVDGAVSLDPTALSYLLQVTGPGKTAAGQVVSAHNVVALTEQVAYARYPDNAVRKKFLLAVARAADDRILGAKANGTALVKAAGKAAGERRLLVWSADPAVQADLAGLPLAGAIPATPTTFAGVVVNNAAGGKLDYYLRRTLRWQASGCGDRRSVTVTITLTNSAPANLPPYATTRADSHSYPVQPGDNRLLVSYYASTGATLNGVTLDGKGVKGTATTELGHPVYTVDVELPRGATRTMVVTMTEPAGGAPQVLNQPLVIPMQVDVVKPAACR